jgi:thioredoxin-related protein
VIYLNILHPMRELFFGILVWWSFGVEAQGRNGIQFDHELSWMQVAAHAKSEKKYIFLDLFASWCAPCKLMDASVYTNDSVGCLMNERFIAVKVQMDSTGKDDGYTKSWYQVAREIEEKYRLNGYPGFLFFTPEGQLIYKDFGYKGVHDFIEMESLVLEPKRTAYYELIDNYKNGIKDYSELGKLAVFTKDVIGDKKLAMEMAGDYKRNYLDRLSESELLNGNYLTFISKFSNLIDSSDHFFDICYKESRQVDSIMGPNWAEDRVNETITREYIADKLELNGRPVMKDPNWSGIASNIRARYPAVNSKRIVLQYQIKYYRYVDLEWDRYAKYFDKKVKADVKRYRYGSSWMGIFFNLNLPAWDMFLNCEDRKALKIGLHWSDLSIRLCGSRFDALQCLDTRANILYKLGRTREAIVQEEAALGYSEGKRGKNERKGPFFDDYAKTLAEMMNGEPTNLSSGAKWDAKTIPKMTTKTGI